MHWLFHVISQTWHTRLRFIFSLLMATIVFIILIQGYTICTAFIISGNAFS